MLRPLLITAALCAPASAQFWARLVNPDVEVTLHHPPSLGLKVTRIAFLPVGGATAQDLVAACTTDLSARGQMEILDRANFNAILREQSLGESGYLDPSTVTKLGKLLGAAALVTVNVSVCKPTQTHLTNHTTSKDKNGNTRTDYDYISKTEVQFVASVQVTDLTTGKIYKAQRIVASPSQEAHSDRGYPEFPLEVAVREAAIQVATGTVHRLFLPWDEARKLIFFDDKDYQMKEAHKALLARNYPLAYDRARASLDAAKADPEVKPKYLARANYNLGMVAFIQGDLEGAKPYLQAAVDIDPSADIFQQSLGECQRALQLREESRQVDDRSEAQRRAEARSLAGVDASEAAAPPAQASGPGSAEERLERLKAMLKKGLITKQEYDQKRAEILKAL